MDIERQLREFITSDLGWSGRLEDLTSEYPLIEKDVIDSLGIFELVRFIEGHYGISVDDEELVAENFGTLAAITRLVQGKVPS